MKLYAAIKKYRKYFFEKKYPYKVIDIIETNNENNDIEVLVQLSNSLVKRKMSPEEILLDDENTKSFSPTDIRAITYIGYISSKKNQSKYKSIANKLSLKDNRMKFLVVDEEENSIMSGYSNEIYQNKEVINNIDSIDAYKLGYTTAIESQNKEIKDKKEPDKIREALNGFWLTSTLRVALRLSIADKLANGPQNIEYLSSNLKVNNESLYRILRCLSKYGIFNEESGKIFSNNKYSKNLISTQNNSMKDFGIFISEVLYEGSLGIMESVKTGNPGFDLIKEMNIWEYLNKNQELNDRFSNGLFWGAKQIIKNIVNSFDFSIYKNIIDIGGGHGQLAIEIAKQTKSKCTILDLEQNKKGAEQNIKKENINNCSFLSGDFFKSIPTGNQLLILKTILHDWNNEKINIILERCYSSMNEKDRILIIESCFDSSTTNNLYVCFQDINMMVNHGGKERHLDEYCSLMQSNKFNLIYKEKIEHTNFYAILFEK